MLSCSFKFFQFPPQASLSLACARKKEMGKIFRGSKIFSRHIANIKNFDWSVQEQVKWFSLKHPQVLSEPNSKLDWKPMALKDGGEASSKLVLYSYWLSSCSWRVRFALNLKGLSYDYKAVNLAKGEQFTSEFEKLNPLHFVPVLVDGDVIISDSYAILMYLEEKYPQRTLLPADTQRKALNLQVASIINSSIQPLHMLSILKYLDEKVGPQEQHQFAQTVIEKGFLALEKLLKDFSGKYATGEEVYMADVFMAPQIAVASERFKIDMLKFPTLSRIYKSHKALPEFLAASPERQPDAVS